MYNFQHAMDFQTLLSHSDVRKRMLAPAERATLPPEEYASIIYGAKVERLQLTDEMVPAGQAFSTHTLPQYPSFNEQYKQLMDRLKMLGKQYLTEINATKLNNSLDNIYEGKSEYTAGFNMEETNALKMVLEEFVIVNHLQVELEMKKEMLIELVQSISDRCAVGLVGRISDICRAFNPEESLAALLGICRGNIVTGMVVNQQVHYAVKLAAFLNENGYNIPETTTMSDRYIPGQFNDQLKPLLIAEFERQYFSMTTLKAVFAMVHQRVEMIIANDENTSAEAIGKISRYLRNIFGFPIDLNQIFEYNSEPVSNRAKDVLIIKKRPQFSVLEYIAISTILRKLFEGVNDPTRVLQFQQGSIDITKYNGLLDYSVINDGVLTTIFELPDWLQQNNDSELKKNLIAFLLEEIYVLLIIQYQNYDIAKYVRETFGVSMLARSVDFGQEMFDSVCVALKHSNALNDELAFEFELNDQKISVLDIFIDNASESLLTAYFTDQSISAGYFNDPMGGRYLNDNIVKRIYQRNNIQNNFKLTAFMTSRYKHDLNESMMMCKIIFSYIYSANAEIKANIIAKMYNSFETDMDKVLEMYISSSVVVANIPYHIRALSMLKYMSLNANGLSFIDKCKYFGKIISLPVEGSIAEKICKSEIVDLKKLIATLFEWDLQVRIQSIGSEVATQESYLDFGDCFVEKEDIENAYEQNFFNAYTLRYHLQSKAIKRALAELLAERSHPANKLKEFLLNENQHDFFEYYFNHLIRVRGSDQIFSALKFMDSLEESKYSLSDIFYDKYPEWIKNNVPLIIEQVKSNKFDVILGYRLIIHAHNSYAKIMEDLRDYFKAVNDSPCFNQIMQPSFGRDFIDKEFFYKLAVYADTSLLNKFTLTQVFLLCRHDHRFMEIFFEKTQCSPSIFHIMAINGKPLKYCLPSEFPEKVRHYMISNGVISLDTPTGESAFVNAIKSGLPVADLNLMINKMADLNYVDADKNNYLYHAIFYALNHRMLGFDKCTILSTLVDLNPSLINQVNIAGNTPLMALIKRVPNQASVATFVAEMVDKKRDVIDFKVRNREGQSMYDLFRMSYPLKSADFLLGHDAAEPQSGGKRRKI